eukprot:g7343.t1
MGNQCREPRTATPTTPSSRNFTALQSIYVQERMPPGRKNQALVANNIFYCLTAIAMAASCRDLTQHMDWRIEVLLWCCLPPTLGVLVAWPQWWNILTSLPAAARRALFAKQTGKVAVVPLPSPESEVLPEPQSLGPRECIVRTLRW